MRKIISAIALAFVSLLAAPAQAASDSASVTVTINLTSKCVFGAVAPVVFAYTSFQAAPATATGGTFNMKCTDTMPYKIGFTNAAVPATTETVTDSASTGLIYTLGLLSSTGTGTGSGVDQAYTVSGTMALGQAGTCLTASCTGTNTRTLYVSY